MTMASETHTATAVLYLIPAPTPCLCPRSLGIPIPRHRLACEERLASFKDGTGTFCMERAPLERAASPRKRSDLMPRAEHCLPRWATNSSEVRLCQLLVAVAGELLPAGWLSKQARSSVHLRRSSSTARQVCSTIHDFAVSTSKLILRSQSRSRPLGHSRSRFSSSCPILDHFRFIIFRPHPILAQTRNVTPAAGLSFDSS